MSNGNNRPAAAKPIAAAAAAPASSGAQSSDPVAELTAEQLLEQFRSGGGPKGASALALTYDGLVAANERLEGDNAALAAERDAGVAALETANEELAALGKALETAKAAATKAQKAAKVSQGEKAPAARKFDTDPEKVLHPEQIKAAIEHVSDTGKTIEICFCSDGKEITGLNPVRVEGAAWRLKPTGLMLTEAVTLHGPASGELPFAIDGFGLLIDGKPAAYRARLGGAQSIAPGGTLKLQDDIIL